MGKSISTYPISNMANHLMNIQLPKRSSPLRPFAASGQTTGFILEYGCQLYIRHHPWMYSMIYLLNIASLNSNSNIFCSYHRCDVFHYGQPQLPQGFCTACDCTGNSDSCDPITGVCLNCQGGTTGDNCERCINETYGDASQQSCQRMYIYTTRFLWTTVWGTKAKRHNISKKPFGYLKDISENLGYQRELLRI